MDSKVSTWHFLLFLQSGCSFESPIITQTPIPFPLSFFRAIAFAVALFCIKKGVILAFFLRAVH